MRMRNTCPIVKNPGSDILNADSAVTDVIASFQGRFRQSKVDGVLDNETATRIAAVAVRFAAARG